MNLIKVILLVTVFPFLISGCSPKWVLFTSYNSLKTTTTDFTPLIEEVEIYAVTSSDSARLGNVTLPFEIRNAHISEAPSIIHKYPSMDLMGLFCTDSIFIEKQGFVLQDLIGSICANTCIGEAFVLRNLSKEFILLNMYIVDGSCQNLSYCYPLLFELGEEISCVFSPSLVNSEAKFRSAESSFVSNFDDDAGLEVVIMEKGEFKLFNIQEGVYDEEFKIPFELDPETGRIFVLASDIDPDEKRIPIRDYCGNKADELNLYR